MNKTEFSVLLVIMVIAVGGLLVLRGRSTTPRSTVSNVPDIPTTGTSTSLKDSDKKVLPPLATLQDRSRVVIETTLGVIKLVLYDADAPKTTTNFKKLIDRKFYDGLIFHRVVAGFVIQGGDPQGSGTGGPGYTFEDELNSATLSYKEGYKKGVLAMANAGPNTNGSQFFITLADVPLPHSYTIFGKVIEGQNVVDRIGAVPVDGGSKPVTPVVMKRVYFE